MSFGIPVRNGLGVGLLASTFLSSLRIGGRPAMFLNFIGTDALDPRITFTRASTATFVGSNGLIQSAAINTPRFDYDPVTLVAKGLLIEEQRTNLVLRSEEFDNASWTKTNTTVTANAASSPDGTANADALFETSATGTHTTQRTTITITANATMTGSVFLKPNGRTNFDLRLQGSTGQCIARGSLVGSGSVSAVNSGAGVTSAVSITPYADGWYRVTVSGIVNATDVTEALFIYTRDDTGATSFTGDPAKGFYVYGAQLEAGAFATSYIPTVASQVTRSADVATMTGTNFSSWYNQSEGTFVLGGDVFLNTGNRVWMDVGPNGVLGTTAYIVQGASSIQLAPNAAPVNMASQVATTALSSNVAIALAANNSVISANGTIGVVDTTCAMPASATQLAIGTPIWNLGGAATLNGHIRRIAYYRQRLPNATLQALTA